MRVLIVCDFLLKYGAQQARSLARVGHDVALLCRSHSLEFGGAADERDELFATLRREGITVIVIPGPPFRECSKYGGRCADGGPMSFTFTRTTIPVSWR
jgi:hypothetical protein